MKNHQIQTSHQSIIQHFKNSLASDKKLTKFEDEKIVKDYLGLESVRFEERLKTSLIFIPIHKNFWFLP
jgi:hypothetical protein